MKKIFSKEFVIGLSVILTVVILYFGIEFLKGINVFKAANYYYASFTNVDGLTTSSSVMLDGFKVGQVREISYDYEHPGHIKVEISLDKQLHLPQGTKAIMTSALLGEGDIVLNLGKESANYPVGATIEGVNPKGMMESVTTEVLPTITAMIPKVDSLLIAVTEVVTNPALASSIEKLDRVMANLETSTQRLSVTMNQLNPIVSDAGVIASNLNTASGDLTTLTSSLTKLPIDSTFNNIHSITADVASATAQLNNPNSSLGMLLHSDGLYNNLNHSVASLDSLLIDVKKNPKRYISIKLL